MKEVHDHVGEALGRVSRRPNSAVHKAKANGGAYRDPDDHTPTQHSAWKVGSFSAKELQSMTFPPLSWIVPNIIPAEGVTLLCSKPKFGKSWLAYDLCIACTTERYIFGNIKPAQGCALYLALEDSKRRKPILVVVDVLAKVRKPVGNRQLYEADYAALADLTELAHELGLAIIVVSVFAHQLGLGSAGFGTKKIAGVAVGAIILLAAIYGYARQSRVAVG